MSAFGARVSLHMHCMRCVLCVLCCACRYLGQLLVEEVRVLWAAGSKAVVGKRLKRVGALHAIRMGLDSNSNFWSTLANAADSQQRGHDTSISCPSYIDFLPTICCRWAGWWWERSPWC